MSDSSTQCPDVSDSWHDLVEMSDLSHSYPGVRFLVSFGLNVRFLPRCPISARNVRCIRRCPICLMCPNLERERHFASSVQLCNGPALQTHRETPPERGHDSVGVITRKVPRRSLPRPHPRPRKLRPRPRRSPSRPSSQRSPSPMRRTSSEGT